MRSHVRNYKKVSRVKRAQERLAEWNKLSPEQKEARKAENKARYDAQRKVS